MVDAEVLRFWPYVSVHDMFHLPSLSLSAKNGDTNSLNRYKKDEDMMVKKAVQTCLLLLMLFASVGRDAQEKSTGYQPEVHGTIRAKYEYQPDLSAGRFEVRNARFSLSGKVAPFVAYKAEIDLCDEGNIKMLDAYTRLTPLKNWQITLGQMRVPFTIDAHRSPHQQYFANLSFIAKQVGNVRDVGFTMG